MGAHVEGYRSFLLGLGYTPGTVRGMLRVLGQLGRWMEAGELDPADLDEARLGEFLDSRRADPTRKVPYRRGLLLLLDFLRAEQVVPPADPPPLSQVDEAVSGYVDWLVADRGLAARTVVRYRRTAWRFLTQRSGGGGGPWTGLEGAEVNAFLLAESKRCSVGAAKGRVAEMRSLLRYGSLHRLIEVPLAGSIPSVAGWHHTSIPISVSSRVVELLLDSCDRVTPLGLRDFAVLMLLARLGLRSIEVSRLLLDDIDNLRAASGIGAGSSLRPRIHDLRHTFAVTTLLGWYRDGDDVASRMPWLSTYLGHLDPSSTYWYLSAAPQLLAVAAQRLDPFIEQAMPR